ncbi:MAG: bifunctional oligoribonuclease/PAP phosphatase NrnA [Clostridia bacterium]|nr:bifunctional oligoribonuclease/PAP phosphatase NrnA [Clostridia bacterium]
MFEAIIEKIKDYNRIIIHRHNNPDGDALGSQLGLKHILLDNFPTKEIFAVGDGSVRYGFMLKEDKLDELSDADFSGALSIILDTSASHLISDDRYKLAACTCRIDHHIFCEKIAQVEVTDTSYESCCGLVTELAVEAGFKLSPRSAKALYTGMVTDSGRFRYDSTTAKTHRLASKLMEEQFDTSDIYSALYSDELEFIKNRARFVLKIQLTDAPVAYIYTTREELSELGIEPHTASRSMVNTMGEIKGVDIWVNFTESEDCVLAELRSSKYNINQIAVKYGGGGHLKASGASLENKEMAMNMLADLISLTGEDK